MGKRVVIGLVAGIAALGMKFYNKSADAQDVKSHLVSLCADDARCVKSDQLVSCLNGRSGQPYFTANK